MSFTTGMPDILSESRVWLSEEDVATDYPWPMHGRIDQLFLHERRRLGILVDTKSRKRFSVYLKDVIQLSAYRFIIERGSRALLPAGTTLHPIGYIRIPGMVAAEDVYLPVRLLDASEVFQLAMRHAELSALGLAARPERCEVTSFCESCSQRDECHALG